MPKYMTQKMEDTNGKCIAITYYKKQSDHPSHDESGAFTQAAKRNFATFNHISEGKVKVGSYKSGQGVPTGGKTFELK